MRRRASARRAAGIRSLCHRLPRPAPELSLMERYRGTEYDSQTTMAPAMMAERRRHGPTTKVEAAAAGRRAGPVRALRRDATPTPSPRCGGEAGAGGACRHREPHARAAAAAGSAPKRLAESARDGPPYAARPESGGSGLAASRGALSRPRTARACRAARPCRASRAAAPPRRTNLRHPAIRFRDRREKVVDRHRERRDSRTPGLPRNPNR